MVVRLGDDLITHLSFYFVVRNTFASVEVIETFLYRRHKLNALGHLFERAVVREGANRFKYDLFLCHGPI